ncbi:DEAD/DEAH box helicase [Methanolobus sp. ZRKC4]
MLNNATAIELEKPYSNIVPDISIWNNNKIIAAIEIISTPDIGLEKRQLYNKHKIPVIFIDVSIIENYLYFEKSSFDEESIISNVIYAVILNNTCQKYCDFTHLLTTKKMLLDHFKRKEIHESRTKVNEFQQAFTLITEEIPTITLPKVLQETHRIRIDSLSLPREAIDIYTSAGIEELYPPQSEIVNKGLLEGNNILAAIPTACGKTLVAELAMLKHVLNGGKALYIVPLRALASEKYERFKEFESLGIKTGISTGELESKSEQLGKNDIIVCTSEKTDSMLRNGTTWLQDLSIVVVDEVHLLGDSLRGPTVDIVITKLRSIPNLQIVSLSATIGNAEVLAEWLDAELVVSEWRPTILNEGIAIGKAMNFFTGENLHQEKIKHDTKDISANIVLDTIEQGAQCLVFESSRRNCAGFAKRFSNIKNQEQRAINALLDSDTKKELAVIADEVELSSNTGEAKILADCIRNGSAYHHAGLNATQRKLVEEGFKNNLIQVISCTPTLAAGINLPARKVIIRNYSRFNPEWGMVPIPVLEYKQMVGRAGRPHLDPEGFSLLLAKEAGDIDELKEKYIFATAEDIDSYLRDESILRSHVLGIISSSSSISQQGIIEFFLRTFSAHTGDDNEFIESICSCIEFLQNHEMITNENNLHMPTKLGLLISRMYINPLAAAIITEKLEYAKQSNMKLTTLSLLQLICITDEIRPVYIKNNELAEYSCIALKIKEDIIFPPDEHADLSYEYQSYLESLKNTLILKDWINEVDTEVIVEKYSTGEGDLHNLSSGAARIASAINRIAALREYDIPFNGLDTRLEYGAGPELVELLKIKNVGRKRARLLYTNHVRSVETLKACSFEQVAKLLGEKITLKIFKQLSMPVPSSVENSIQAAIKNSAIDAQKSLFDF